MCNILICKVIIQMKYLIGGPKYPAYKNFEILKRVFPL